MTPEQIALVQESFKKVEPIAETAADLFYNKLFELDPQLRGIFKGDMKEQGRQLMLMIKTAVNGLAHLEKIVPAVEQLGRRHATYGVRSQDYDTVAQALLWTLEQGLKDAWNDNVKGAWIEVYTVLAGTMKEAASKAA